jgi:hypothetical protein
VASNVTKIVVGVIAGIGLGILGIIVLLILAKRL